jgi:aspartate aminotransferase-like enzyme
LGSGSGWGKIIFSVEAITLSNLPQLPCLVFLIEDVPTRKRLLNEYHIEVGGGLGHLKGKIWRIGLMGETCCIQSIHSLMGALKEILA